MREEAGALRKLSTSSGTDFSSNDYLGFAINKRISVKAALALHETEDKKNGSGASRLIAGHNELFEKCEAMLADFHNAEEALIFNSGYDANIGFFGCIATRNDTIIYDYLSHASIRDGIRLSQAKAFSFDHNNIEDLKKKLKNAQGTVFVAVEAVYSMDGDEAPLEELVKVCEKNNAYLVVDEAHSTGIYGNGAGLCCQLEIEDQVFARLHTFGKAMGCHGAAWLGSKELKEYLINYSRSFIYTTALPAHSLHTLWAAYEELGQSKALMDRLQSNIQLFKDQLKSYAALLPSNSPIQGWLVPGNKAVVAAAEYLQSKGLDVRPIRYPTVPEGSERLRIILHAYNSTEEIKLLTSTLKETAR